MPITVIACSGEGSSTATPNAIATELANVRAISTAQSATATAFAQSAEETIQALENTPTPEPTSPLPTPPPPTPEPEWNLDDIELIELSCTDFHPGVPPETGPNHWIDVAGRLESSRDDVAVLNLRLEVLSAAGEVLWSAIRTDLQVAAQDVRFFSEQFDLPSPPADGSCRVSLSESAFEPGATGVEVVPVEQLFAP